ncbi:uncharacterized protein LOC121233093 isoform X2 [Aquila chrysaetos chrysaetos]|uniref:uncharacterized protein LOC121233093 isoform X2 n=1 Tax=Aquila chrysaetos chrysaetos TaxID=223781 RepID=UPI001B7D330D|nr:uncharacterized protein LOC121233093 isoform X2 [Aquila chrysaetos chrysaetos]
MPGFPWQNYLHPHGRTAGSSSQKRVPAWPPRTSAAPQVLVSTGMGQTREVCGCGYRTRARVCCPCVNPWSGDSSNAGLGHLCAIPPGDLPAPNLFLNTFGTQDWKLLLFHCSIDRHSPATRIIFCKDGVEEHSMKAQQGKLSYIMERNVTLGSEGTYTCGYQHRNRSNWVRSSALSTPQNLTFTGSESSSQEGTSTTGE